MHHVSADWVGTNPIGFSPSTERELKSKKNVMFLHKGVNENTEGVHCRLRVVGCKSLVRISLKRGTNISGAKI